MNEKRYPTIEGMGGIMMARVASALFMTSA